VNSKQLPYVYVQAVETFRMPLPMVTVMASGKSVAGKLRCVKEFLVVPAPGMPLLDVCSVFSIRYDTTQDAILMRAQKLFSLIYCTEPKTKNRKKEELKVQMGMLRSIGKQSWESMESVLNWISCNSHVD